MVVWRFSLYACCSLVTLGRNLEIWHMDGRGRRAAQGKPRAHHQGAAAATTRTPAHPLLPLAGARQGTMPSGPCSAPLAPAATRIGTLRRQLLHRRASALLPPPPHLSRAAPVVLVHHSCPKPPASALGRWRVVCLPHTPGPTLHVARRSTQLHAAASATRAAPPDSRAPPRSPCWIE